MTRQDKIDRLNKKGHKVVFVMSGEILVGGKKFNSINQAHIYYFGY